MNNQSIMRISRSNEIKNNLDQAILWLDSVNFEAGYIIMVNYFVNGPGSDIDAVLALGLKTGKGRSAYKVISATKPSLIWGVIFSDDDLPDVSSLAHDEEYLYKDPKTSTWYIINLSGNERVFNEISDTPKTYINLADGTFWVSNENKKVARINDIADYYTKEEIDILISGLDADLIQDDKTLTTKTWSSSKISQEISGISTDIIQDNGNPSLTKTWSSYKINQALSELDPDLIQDNTTSLDKTWSSEKIDDEITGLIDDTNTSSTTTWSSETISNSTVWTWATSKIEAEYLSKFSVSVDSTSGQNYKTDEATQTTMTLTIKTEYNGSLVPADTPLPNGWTNTGTPGKYSSSVTGSSGTIPSATFYYTIPNTGGLRASGSSPARNITSTNPAWWGIVPSNDPTAEITSQMFSSYLTHRLTSNYNQTIEITNPNQEQSYLWVLTKNTAEAIQFGSLNLFSGYTSGKSFTSPNNPNITMSGYKLYIATNPVAVGGSYGNVNLKINL